jgi:hypothetical protein
VKPGYFGGAVGNSEHDLPCANVCQAKYFKLLILLPKENKKKKKLD